MLAAFPLNPSWTTAFAKVIKIINIVKIIKIVNIVKVDIGLQSYLT
jgi:hypothetical protein